MLEMHNWKVALAAVLLAVSGCGGQDQEEGLEGDPAHTVQREDKSAQVEQEIAAAQGEIAERADSVSDAFNAVRGLSRRERADLRRDVNARQVATARSMGVRASSEEEIQQLLRQGRLVQLEDSTRYWVLRDLNYSAPYVTPDTRAMLEEIGRRFHERLDSLGLPPYRMEITSVLRTPKNQADLRRRNPNAARGVSAHEFGTTVDVAHIRFTAPAASEMTVEIPSGPEHTAAMRYVEALTLDEAARRHAAALQAELGRVLREMRQENKLHVMMERQQAVYHMTVARRLARTAQRE